MIYGTFGPLSWTKQCQSSAFRRHLSGIFHVFVSPAIVVCRIGPSLPIIVFDLGPMIWYSATIVMLILFMYSHICRIVVVRFLSSNGVWAGISNSRFWCQCFCRFCALVFFVFFFGTQTRICLIDMSAMFFGKKPVTFHEFYTVGWNYYCEYDAPRVNPNAWQLGFFKLL